MIRHRALAACLLTLSLLLATVPGSAQEATLEGHWRGQIEVPGTPLQIDVDFTRDGDGWKADISIPAQNARDLALAGVALDGDAVRFSIPGVPGEPTFAGTLAGDEIRGDFTQGGSTLPFVLTRGEDRAAAARQAIEGIDALIDEALADFGVPGLAIAVVAADEVVMARGYGVREVGEPAPVTADTLFAIGSTSKAFTVFVLGTLVQEGKIEWDRPVIEYLPEFRLLDDHATRRLKVRDLVIHSSGLPRHDLLWYANPTATRAELFERLRYLEPSRDLGEEYQYQNLMFMTAGYLAERLTDKTWEQLVRERIFEPLAMHRSNFSVNDSQQDPDHASAHATEDGVARRIPFRNIDAIGPAGSINSSVAEMAGWIRLQLGGGEIDGTRLLDEATLREMHTPQMAISAYPSNQRTLSLGYGMAWGLEAYRGHFLVAHGGGIDGFISWVALLPYEDLGVVVYTNASGFNPLPGVIARTVIDRILGLEDGGHMERAHEQLKQAQEAAAEAERNAEARRREGTSPSHPLESYAGEYDHPGYGTIEVTLADDGLHLQYGSVPVRLEHWHYDTFNGADDDGDPTLVGSKFQFRLDVHGEVAELVGTLEPNVPAIVFIKAAEEQLSDPDYLQRFVGIYELPNQRATVTLRGDRLQVSLPGQPTYSLQPLRGTEFELSGLEGFSMEFLMGEAGAVTGVRFIQPNGVFEATRVEG